MLLALLPLLAGCEVAVLDGQNPDQLVRTDVLMPPGQANQPGESGQSAYYPYYPYHPEPVPGDYPYYSYYPYYPYYPMHLVPPRYPSIPPQATPYPYYPGDAYYPYYPYYPSGEEPVDVVSLCLPGYEAIYVHDGGVSLNRDGYFCKPLASREVHTYPYYPYYPDSASYPYYPS
ncbi:MAG: hypothetical protein ACAI44_30155 [Candidatus Sericytochromatia bacterium]